MRSWHLFPLFTATLVVACSTEQAKKEDAKPRFSVQSSGEIPDTTNPVVAAQVPSDQGILPPSEPPGVSEGPNLFQTDADSLAEDVEGISQKLENARQHYLSALSAMESGDTLLCEQEFEFAIGILNELSYYPEIDANKDFADLSHSIVEDYERHIAVIDDLGPEASIFALREKLSQEVE
ncbi:MAG: hypothetical protein WD295_04105 [Bacteroidota bacterium]